MVAGLIAVGALRVYGECDKATMAALKPSFLRTSVNFFTAFIKILSYKSAMLVYMNTKDLPTRAHCSAYKGLMSMRMPSVRAAFDL